jgi:23S rRNA pseudouridine1911/1915/1917 synthase
MLEPTILYETKDFVAVSKPAGLVVHHGVHVLKTKEDPTLCEWLALRYPELRVVGDDPENRPGIVHRLDKDTSGVMLIPRNQKYFEYLKKLFQDHEVNKTYVALVAGKPKQREGVIDRAIGIKSGTTKRSVFSEKMAKSAITRFSVVGVFENNLNPKNISLVKIYPETGRTHQIRVHLASIGCPVLGDKLYGGGYKNVTNRLMLHALAVEFFIKSGEKILIEAELPDDFKLILDKYKLKL